MTDRELDALVAEKVIGLLLWDPALSFVKPCWIKQKNDVPTLSEIGAGISLPHYSTDISAAWEVVENMKTRGFDYELSGCSSEEGGIAIFQPCPEDTKDRFRGDAPTISRAICLAALNAVGVEVPS